MSWGLNMRGEPVTTKTFMKQLERKLQQMQLRKSDYPTVWRTIEKERTNDVKMTVMAEGFGRLRKLSTPTRTVK